MTDSTLWSRIVQTLVYFQSMHDNQTLLTKYHRQSAQHIRVMSMSRLALELYVFRECRTPTVSSNSTGGLGSVWTWCYLIIISCSSVFLYSMPTRTCWHSQSLPCRSSPGPPACDLGPSRRGVSLTSLIWLFTLGLHTLARAEALLRSSESRLSFFDIGFDPN